MTDCGLRFPEKPRTAGLCGRAAGACDCGPLSCYIFERGNRGRKPPKRDLVGRETHIQKDSVFHCRSRIHRGLSHIAHKRRNVRFKGLRRVHTPPQPRTAHTTAHTLKHGGFSGSMVTMFPVAGSSTPSTLFRQIRRSPLLLRKDTVIRFSLERQRFCGFAGRSCWGSVPPHRQGRSVRTAPWECR